MSEQDIKTILLSTHIDFFDIPFEFFVQKKGDGFLVQLGAMITDNDSKEESLQKGRKYYVSKWAIKDEVVMTAWKAFQDYIIHEMRESFFYKGQDIFNPHYNLDQLADFASKSKRAKRPPIAHGNKINFFDTDVFVFTSHKTASGTITYSIKESSKLNVFREHIFEDTKTKCGIEQNVNMKELCSNYFKSTNKKLPIISIYRNPLDRLMSSFFQYNHSREVEKEDIPENMTTIMSNNLDRLVEMFSSTMFDMKYYPESINKIIEDFNIDLEGKKFNPDHLYYTIEMEHAIIYLSRFDVFLNNISEILSKILNIKIDNIPHNLTSDKIYKDKYEKFKNSFSYTQEQLDKINQDRKILEKFFNG